MHYLTLAQETERGDVLLVVRKVHQMFICRPRLLLCCKILVDIGDRISGAGDVCSCERHAVGVAGEYGMIVHGVVTHQPGAFDIALLIGDDPDYAPVLRRARLFGKRIQIVGAHDADGKQPPPAATLATRSRVADFPLLWIDDHASEVRLVRERVTRVCKQCGREEETTWAGPEFFCVACRGRHRK